MLINACIRVCAARENFSFDGAEHRFSPRKKEVTIELASIYVNRELAEIIFCNIYIHTRVFRIE